MVESKKSKQLRKVATELHELIPSLYGAVNHTMGITLITVELKALQIVLEKNQVIAPGAVKAEVNVLLDETIESLADRLKEIKDAIG